MGVVTGRRAETRGVYEIEAVSVNRRKGKQ